MNLIDIKEDSVIWANAKKLYGIGRRVYHTFQHAQDVLHRVEWVEDEIGFINPEAARLAALFHDAVYVIGSSDNESLSARCMTRIVYDNTISVLSEELASCIYAATVMIRATAQHMTHQEFFTDWDTMLFMDCDMFGFAMSWDEFQKNNAGIDAEFKLGAGYNQEKYEVQRIKFLTTLYNKGIFRSPYFRKKYEERALYNIREYLIPLGATDLPC